MSEEKQMFEANNQGDLTRSQILGGNAGHHKLTEKLTGFKKIQCYCSNISWFYTLTGNGPAFTKESGIATLELKEGSTIIRPRTTYDSYFHNTYSLDSTKLRTDAAFVTNIENTSRFGQSLRGDNCECYSIYSPSYKYKINQIHKPVEPLDTDINRECRSGIHFFLTKSEAQDYAA